MKNKPNILKQDRVIAVLLISVVLLVGFINLGIGMDFWGDDHTAYITEGIAIANGTLEEQAQRNVMLHPTSLPEETQDKLIYVWGYPLMLAGIYKLAGFNTETYGSIVYYKLPSLFCFAIFAGVLYMYYRRRFSRNVSLTVSLLLTGLPFVYVTINKAYSDFPFLLFCMLVYDLGERLCHIESGRKAKWIAISILYAVSMWACYVIRLNGIAVIALMGAMHIFEAVQHRREMSCFKLALMFMPYLLMAVGLLISYRFLPVPTSNMSDLYGNLLRNLVDGIQYYGTYFTAYHCLPLIAAIPAAVIIVIGMCIAVRREAYTVILTVGTIAGMLILPYHEGIRYLFYVMPFIVLYFIYGAMYLTRGLRRLKVPMRVMKIIAVCAVMIVWCFSLYSGVRNVSNILQGKPLNYDDMYSNECIETYHFIRENVSENQLIACRKPRALYLNTGRMGFYPGNNGHKASDADFILMENMYLSDEESFARMINEDTAENWEVIFQNRQFTLYRAL